MIMDVENIRNRVEAMIKLIAKKIGIEQSEEFVKASQI